VDGWQAFAAVCWSFVRLYCVIGLNCRWCDRVIAALPPAGYDQGQMPKDEMRLRLWSFVLRQISQKPVSAEMY
jgi:hypothetical protein